MRPETPDELKLWISRNLASLYRSKASSLSELARRVGISHRRLRRARKSSWFDSDFAHTLCKAVGVDVATLVLPFPLGFDAEPTARVRANFERLYRRWSSEQPDGRTSYVALAEQCWPDDPPSSSVKRIHRVRENGWVPGPESLWHICRGLDCHPFELFLPTSQSIVSEALTAQVEAEREALRELVAVRRQVDAHVERLESQLERLEGLFARVRGATTVDLELKLKRLGHSMDVRATGPEDSEGGRVDEAGFVTPEREGAALQSARERTRAERRPCEQTASGIDSIGFE